MSDVLYRLEDLRANVIEPDVSGFTATSRPLAGMDTEWITPSAGGSDLFVLYFHGGGYICGDARQYRGATVGLAIALNATVVVPNYRLAPENPPPASHDDARAAAAALIDEHGVDPSKLLVAGDSAGCSLATWVLLGRAGTGSQLLGAILNSPYADLTASSPSLYDEQHASPKLPTSRIRWIMSTYLGDRDPTHPRHSPVLADLTGLPPLLIQVGGKDPLHDDGVRLAERAHACGVDAWVSDYPASEHVWVAKGTTPPDPERERALAEAADFVANLRKKN